MEPLDIEKIQTQIKQFFKDNKEEIVSLYKGNVAVFQCSSVGEKRHFPDIQICFADIPSPGILFVNHSAAISELDDNPEILTGYTLATLSIKNDRFIKCDAVNRSLTEYKRINNLYIKHYAIDKPPLEENEDINYICDAILDDACASVGGNRLDIGGMICEECNDYDICSACASSNKNLNNHPHKMFEYRGHIGWNTYEFNSVITSVTFPLNI